MANYNIHAPHIIGQEWVPIRQANYPTDDNITERGYTMRIETAVTPVTGAYYIAEVPENRTSQLCDLIAVYPAGRETLSGPIKKLHIPASAVATTGPGVDIVTNGGLSALFNPSDGLNILFNAPGGSDELQVSFDTAAYAQQLFGKRIIDVSIRYVFGGFPDESPNLRLLLQRPNDPSGRVFYALSLEIAATLTTPNPVKESISAVSLTDINPYWDTGVSVNQQRNVIPWRFPELNAFRSGAPALERLIVVVDNNLINNQAFLFFMDMEVTYCEETRVLYGARRTSNLNASTYVEDAYSLGQNLVRLYNPSTLAIGAALAAGDYTVTLKHSSINYFSTLSGEPTVYAVRPYYDLLPLDPVRVNISRVEEDQFSLGDETVMTHLTLHTTSSIVTGSHAYGTRYGAPVYGTITATQEIEDDPVGAARTYPQVRFYARRYGNTTVPLTLTDVATGLSTVSITPGEFDALEEIVDGWREVTLRFATPPSFATAAGDVDWRWSATGELAGNQWQVMVADGPSTSVTTPPSLAAALATGPATYYAPQGSTVALTWQAPAISGTGEDSTSDAVLIFSQDPPIVSGFTVEVASQEITGIGLDCGTVPDCIPTAITYLDLTWDLNSVCDTYTREEDGQWGISDSGNVTVTVGGAPENYLVTDGVGVLRFTSNQELQVSYGVTIADLVIRGEVQNFVTPTGAGFEIKIVARYVDANNFVDARLFIGTSGAVTAAVRQVVAGVETVSSFPTVANVTATNEISYIFYVVGTSLRFKAWNKLQLEPVPWTVTFTTSWLTAGDLRVGGQLGGGTTNVKPLEFHFDNLSAVAPELEGATVEVQRFDVRDGLWRTIMLSSNPCPHGFADYEARVGVESQYRVRVLNVLEFAGPWVTGAGTIPAPGVTGAGDGNSILIFTSNAAPDASLAYVMQWENQPIETFAFPEANFVQLQRIFGKDYFTAFYPLERGGEQFTRTLLVNAAAITPSALANFADLRNLAWAQLDYVCVRDELGNRWLANIRIPDGTVQRNRTLYLAQVQVAQVTDTPSPIDPSA